MSDTMTVMTACPCGEAYDSHWIDDDFWCPGGKEIIFRRATRFDGSITMENQVMWVEADDE